MSDTKSISGIYEDDAGYYARLEVPGAFELSVDGESVGVVVHRLPNAPNVHRSRLVDPVALRTFAEGILRMVEETTVPAVVSGE